MESKKEHSSLGKASLILAIIGLVLIVVILLSFFIEGFGIVYIAGILYYPVFLLSLIALILGAIAYFGKEKDLYGLIAFIIGICLFVAAPISIAASTYFYVSDRIGDYQDTTPGISFIQDDDNITVAAADLNVFWSNLSIMGTYEEIPSHPYVLAGDKILNCSGIITIVYTPTNKILWSGTFE